MFGLDTNVLVRYIVKDDDVQARQASQALEGRLTDAGPGFISLVTLVETVWVLESVYDLSSQEVAGVVEHLLQADALLVQNEREVFTALVALKTGRGDFADALIGALGEWAGCSATLSFDKKTKRLTQFRLL